MWYVLQSHLSTQSGVLHYYATRQVLPPIKKKSGLRAGGDGNMRDQVWREETEEESTKRDCWKDVVISRSG